MPRKIPSPEGATECACRQDRRSRFPHRAAALSGLGIFVRPNPGLTPRAIRCRPFRAGFVAYRTLTPRHAGPRGSTCGAILRRSRCGAIETQLQTPSTRRTPNFHVDHDVAQFETSRRRRGSSVESPFPDPGLTPRAIRCRPFRASDVGRPNLGLTPRRAGPQAICCRPSGADLMPCGGLQQRSCESAGSAGVSPAGCRGNRSEEEGRRPALAAEGERAG